MTYIPGLPWILIASGDSCTERMQCEVGLGKEFGSNKSSKLLKVLSRAPLAPDHRPLLRHLAGPLFPWVATVFRGELAPVYILAEPKRRQVWNVVLAATSRTEIDCDTLLDQLLSESCSSLIASVLGSCPGGFTTLLAHCGDSGHSFDFYTFWHEFLQRGGEGVREIVGTGYALDDLYRILRVLPLTLQCVSVAQRFGHHATADRFVDAVRWMNGGTPDEGVWLAVLEQLNTGMVPRRVLDAMFDQVHCADPHIVDHRFRHIATVNDLRMIARKFENCLGMDFTIQEALRGETQFYEWVGGGEPCIVSILNDRPFGYHSGDVKAVGNGEPDLDTTIAIAEALAEHGVVDRPSVADMIGNVPRSIGQPREREIDSLFGEGDWA